MMSLSDSPMTTFSGSFGWGFHYDVRVGPGVQLYSLYSYQLAPHHYVGARRPCTALLGQRVREWNVRNVIAPTLNGY